MKTFEHVAASDMTERRPNGFVSLRHANPSDMFANSLFDDCVLHFECATSNADDELFARFYFVFIFDGMGLGNFNIIIKI